MKKHEVEISYNGEQVKGFVNENELIQFYNLDKESQVEYLKESQSNIENNKKEYRKIREIRIVDGEEFDTGWVNLEENEELYNEIKERFNLYEKRSGDWIDSFKKDFDEQFLNLNKTLSENFKHLKEMPLFHSKNNPENTKTED